MIESMIQKKLVLKKVNILPYVENSVRLISSQNSKNSFRTDADENISEILADTDKFQQIMLNILENASKYSNPDTEINIKISQNDKDIIIKVTDDGVEIP